MQLVLASRIRFPKRKAAQEAALLIRVEPSFRFSTARQMIEMIGVTGGTLRLRGDRIVWIDSPR
jgi:hypothetical protein